MQIIKLSINIDLIEQARLYPGRKGKYLDATLFLNDEADQYGNHGFIAQSVTKEEREAGIRGPIIGNAKLPAKNSAPTQYPAQQPVNSPNPTNIPAAKAKVKESTVLPPQRHVDPEDLPF